jgi:hypothetical protein
LTLIAIGQKVDPKLQYLKQLTNNYAIWQHPEKPGIPEGWEDFFWHEAYGCVGNPPSDAPTPGTVPTITFPIITCKLC